MVVDVERLKRLSGKPSVLVEVGHGRSPAYHFFDKLPLPDQLYLGLDLKADDWRGYDLRRGRADIDERRRSGGPFYRAYLDNDGCLPIRENSVDAIILVMVTSDNWLDIWTVSRLIAQCAQALRDGGVISFVNGPGRLITGDIAIDFQDGSYGWHDRHCERLVSIPALEGHFQPLSIEEHRGLAARYGAESSDREPGKFYSSFRRRTDTRTGGA
ncbi:MAG TPA: hypothetical protein VLD37_07620 [Candidatus Bilamarchaeum sp.]|nr:hypothetical protein [Candidatus Bilamarchaeum sp.]